MVYEPSAGHPLGEPDDCSSTILKIEVFFSHSRLLAFVRGLSSLFLGLLLGLVAEK